MLREHEQQPPDSAQHTNIHHVEADLPRVDLPPMHITGTITSELADTVVRDAKEKISRERHEARVIHYSGRAALSG